MVYGKRGETVLEISRRGHVLIVENKSGLRFPVKDTDVNER